MPGRSSPPALYRQTGSEGQLSLQNGCRSHESKEYLGVSAKVQLVEPKTIQTDEGKAIRVIDNRKS